MQRRKFLIGAAGTAIGGSALVGSGAFTSVEAERDVVVDVADDSDAFLALTAPGGGENTEYADTDGNTISLDISGDDSRTGQSGEEGLNKDASTTFLQLFKVENQGTEIVGVGLENFGERGDEGDDLQSMNWFVGDEHNAQDETSLTSGIEDYDWENPADDLRILRPGEDVWVGAFFFNPTDSFDGTYDVTITAENEGSAEA